MLGFLLVGLLVCCCIKVPAQQVVLVAFVLTINVLLTLHDPAVGLGLVMLEALVITAEFHRLVRRDKHRSNKELHNADAL